MLGSCECSKAVPQRWEFHIHNTAVVRAFFVEYSVVGNEPAFPVSILPSEQAIRG